MLCNLFKQREGRKKKPEIYEETKKRTWNVERTCKKKNSVFAEKEIPLGYVIKLRNEQQGQPN